MSLEQAVSLTDEQVTGLLGAYVERQQFESKVLISVLGEALKPSDKGQDLSLSSLSMMGFGIEGAT